MDYRELNPSRFIKSASFGNRDWTLTIDAIDREVLEGEKGKQVKGIVTFKEKSRQTGEALQWVMNVSNATSLMHMFGKDTDGWIGKRVTLYSQPMKVGGEQTTGIRVRGSPDMEKDEIRYVLKLRKKKDQQVLLKKTGGVTPTKPAADTNDPNNDADPADPRYEPQEVAQ